MAVRYFWAENGFEIRPRGWGMASHFGVNLPQNRTQVFDFKGVS